MNKLTIVQFNGELVATYDDDDVRLIVRCEPTDDFLYDCANLILKFEEKLKEKKGK